MIIHEKINPAGKYISKLHLQSQQIYLQIIHKLKVPINDTGKM